MREVLMILSYPADAGGQARPSKCRCGGRHFHRHGRYQRVITRKWVQRFICTVCGVTTSMIPNSCVPYKHHPTKLINEVIHGLFHGQSGRDYQCEVDRSTCYRWRQDFSNYAPVLSTEGALRLGINAMAGSAKQIYQHFFRHFKAKPGDDIFSILQVQLCAKLPAIGIFRPLTS